MLITCIKTPFYTTTVCTYVTYYWFIPINHIGSVVNSRETPFLKVLGEKINKQDQYCHNSWDDTISCRL